MGGGACAGVAIELVEVVEHEDGRWWKDMHGGQCVSKMGIWKFMAMVYGKREIILVVR